MAVVTLNKAGEDVTVGGSDVEVIGTPSGGEIITVVSGNIRFDPSFNQGGDTIILPGPASDYTAYRSGGEVVFTRDDGLVTIRVPVGTAGIEIQFDGGDSRTLAFDTSTNPPVAYLEGQAISTNSAAPTDINPSGPPPVVGYDVVGSNVSITEGDAGTKLMVFTITLDRPVTAADGSVTLNYVTQNGTADSASDYVAAAGQVTFAVGQQVATVTVQVLGDTIPEANETLTLQLTGAALRNGPETLTGTITNDDVAVGLTGAADNLAGSAGNDAWFAANGGLGAGDKITDPSTADSDTFSLAIDATNPNPNYGGFALTNVERVEVTNDSGVPVTLDMSSSTGVKVVASVNSSDTVVFNQLTSLADVEVNNVTGAAADVQAVYQAGVTAGATTVNVIVNDATVDDIILGTVGAGNTGIETVNMTVNGSSAIDSIDTALTNLVISGNGSVTIDDDLNTSVRSIDATGVAGNLDIEFDDNDGAGQGVTFKGAQGNNLVQSGQAADTITTFGGADVIVDEGGADVVSTGAGDDSVLSGGVGGAYTVDTGTGNDTVEFEAGLFSGVDKVTMGGEAGDTLIVNEGTTEGDYAQVSGATNLTVDVETTTDLGSDGAGSLGQAAGIQVVNLNLDGNGAGAINDTLFAQDYTTGLTVNLGAVAGADIVLLGSGADVVNTASFDNTDKIQGNGGLDTINVQDGATTITGASLFGGVEQINYLSDGDGQDHSLTVDDSNAPSLGTKLTVNGAALTSAESLSFTGTAVTSFAVNVLGGAAADSINTANAIADYVSGGAGNDAITVAGGDTVEAGAGFDNIQVGAGNNIVFGGADGDFIQFGGPGNNSLYGEGGDDTFFVNVSADLNASEIIDGGDGNDLLDVQGTFVDAQFTGVSSVETLQAGVGGASNLTIGAEAQEGGIRTVILTQAGVADTLDASAYTANLTVNSAGGNDVITTGSGADLITTGTGSYTINTGAGDDRIRVSGTELDLTDKIAGADGNDTVELDNTAGTVTGVADLANVSVENFKILGGGDLGPGSDPNANSLTFSSTVVDVVTSVTPINVDASALTDAEDSFSLVIDGTVLDDDFAFNVTGSSTATTVEKQNLGIDNNINFIGGSGVDTLKIDGGDAGSTITFDGNDGQDRLWQTGGVLTDDGFVNMSEVEVLTGDAGDINAVLGAEAAQSGIVRIEGTSGQDKVSLGAAFNNNLTVVLGAGDDIINGGASAATITFEANAGDLTAADALTGGTGTGDAVNITAGGTANLNGVTRVETINVLNPNVGAQATVIDLDWLAAEVDGNVLTINAIGLGTNDTLTVNGGAVTENVTVNGGAGVDTITTGIGVDVVNGNGGADVIAVGDGNDAVNGGTGGDTVRGQLGNDTINGDDGNDTLYGDVAYVDIAGTAYNGGVGPAAQLPGSQYALYNASVGGVDTINGGIGDDTIVGGLRGDNLTGGAGTDTFLYQTRDDSRVFPGGIDNRDVITDFVSGVDKINLLNLPEATGQTVRFNGNWTTFGEGQGAVSGTGGDAFLDVVFVRETNTLWVDVDNNGQLNGEDLQIILQGVTDLVAADVNNPHVVTGPIAAPAEFSQSHEVIDFGSFSRADYGRGWGMDMQTFA